MSHCIYCSSEDKEIQFPLEDIYGDQYHLSECLNCGIYFLDPQPTEEQLSRAYDESYYGVGEKKFNPTVEKVVDWFRQRNAKAFAQMLPPKARVLDIGCGNGNFLHNLSKQGEFELHGIEPEGKSAERAARNTEINLHIGFLEEGTYSENYFDAVILTHVFEHLPNPAEVLSIISKITRKGGILQIEIPNIDSWQAEIFKGNWLHLDPPRHLNMFPPSVLKAELNEQGWELLLEKYISPQFSPFGVQQSILNKICKKREVLYEFLKGNKIYSKEYLGLSINLQKLFHWFSFPIFIMTDIIASAFAKGGTLKLRLKKLD